MSRTTKLIKDTPYKCELCRKIKDYKAYSTSLSRAYRVCVKCLDNVHDILTPTEDKYTLTSYSLSESKESKSRSFDWETVK